MDAIYTNTAEEMAKQFVNDQLIDSYRMVNNANGEPTVAVIKTKTGHSINVITRIYENQEYLTASVYSTDRQGDHGYEPFYHYVKNDSFRRDHILTLQYDINDNTDYHTAFNQNLNQFL